MKESSRPALRASLALVVATLVTVPLLAGDEGAAKSKAAQASDRGNHGAGGQPVLVRGRCEAGQVPKWDGRRWVCADDLVGGGAGGGSSPAPHLVDASNAVIGPLAGTVDRGGVTMARVLVTLADNPKPFLLAVDEAGFVSEGSLILNARAEVTACVAACPPTVSTAAATLQIEWDTQCLASCLTASGGCDPSNAMLEAKSPSALFRPGAVVGATAASAQLWVTTSTTPSPVVVSGSSIGSGGIIPFTMLPEYHPADDTCTLQPVTGSTTGRQAFPAAPLGDLHPLYPPPYVLKPR